MFCTMDPWTVSLVSYEGEKWRRKDTKAGSNSPVPYLCLHCGVSLSSGITHPGSLDSLPWGARGAPHCPSDRYAEEHSTLYWCSKSLSMSHLKPSWVLLSPPSTAKLLRVMPANQRGEKTVLAMRIKSREGNCSFKSVLEVCFTLSLRKKQKTWKLKVNAYFQEKCHVIKW